jgi:hypothetical protein
VSRPDPFGVFTDADGRVVVDDFTNPISNIPAIVREMTRDNQGYWIEDVFNSPGWTIQGGAVATRSPARRPLPPGRAASPAPRAPGSEAPRISGTRRRPIVAYPENLSASSRSRTRPAPQRRHPGPDDVPAGREHVRRHHAGHRRGGADGARLRELAQRELGHGHVRRLGGRRPDLQQHVDGPAAGGGVRPRAPLFVEDKGGVLPDTLIWDPVDAEHFDRVYQDRGDEVLRRYGITNVFTTVRATAGVRTYLKSGQVGTLAWEVPLGDPEYTREGPARPTSTRSRARSCSSPTAPTRSCR